MPAPVELARRESAYPPDPSRSPMLHHSALSNSLSRSFGMNSPFSLSAMSTSLKDLSSSPGFSSMAMSLGRSFEERPKIEAQFFKNFTCCGLDLQDLHGLLEHFEECHVSFDDEEATDGGMDYDGTGADSEGTVSGPPSPRLQASDGHFSSHKRTASSAFDAPDSPGAHHHHLDGGMELDMEMGDEEGPTASPPSSIGSSSSSHLHLPNQPALASFDASLPLHRTSSKKKQQQHQSQAAVAAAGGIPPSATTIPPALSGFDPLQQARSSSKPGTPAADEPPNPVDNLSFLHASAVNPSAALNALGGGPSGVGGSFAPSLLFPTPARSSQSPPVGGVENALQMGSPEPEEEEESEEDEDSTDEEDEAEIAKGFANHPATLAQIPHHALPSLLPPTSSLPPLSPNSLPAVAPSSASPAPPQRQLHHPPHVPRPQQKKQSASPGVSLPPHALPSINPHDPATIAALATTTLRDPMATAAAIAALGPNSLAALPTALHPLGQGVQISPSGRPYTPPSEKPFKCTVPGCDKAYKQQNGLKYHRLHGHCGANLYKGDYWDPKSEGKPYVCHVASCGKRYKNMNGLRYHYQHSGAHGALGLQMLAQGCHPPPQFPPGHKRGFGGHHQLAQSFTAHSSAHSSRASSPAAHGYSRGGVDAGALSAALGGRY
ncbi:hypothetical protein JCM11641_008206 [Rhodosporidiobolus odoratus]